MLFSGITQLDILLSLFFSVAILIIARIFKPDSNKAYSKFFVPFFGLKIIYALIFVLIHVYYFKGGDTFYYFLGSEFFVDQVVNSPLNVIKIFLAGQSDLNQLEYHPLYYTMISASEDVYILSKIISPLSLISAKQYLACSILFTCITAIGVWKLYETLCRLYPSIYKYLAVGILFYPSLGIWGSGILKDPLTLCSLGLIFWSTYNIIQAKNIIISSILIAISAYLCYVLKPYVLYTYIPILFLWTQGRLTKKVTNPILKIIVTPILIIVFSIGTYFAINTVSEGAGKYSLESVQSVAEGFHSWHSYLAETRNQSGYSLGNIEFTPLGILQKSPEAFFVTYYRPFIFVDTRNVATLFEAVQNLVILILTIYILFKVGILKFFKLIINDPDIRAFMLFSIVFGVAVGITSYNFGALSRYKIPSIPFYFASLTIIYYKGYITSRKKSNP